MSTDDRRDKQSIGHAHKWQHFSAPMYPRSCLPAARPKRITSPFSVWRVRCGKARRHVVTSVIEHPAVLQPCQRLAQDGWDVTVVPVDDNARVDLGALARVLRDDTALVTIMHANNEVGTLQDIAEIAKLAHARGALVHTDAAQTIGKIPVDVDALGVDLLTIAGHKFYAPKGVGALYVRRGTPILPVIVGADHEQGLRPGTENVPAIVGLGEAARLARERLRLGRDADATDARPVTSTARGRYTGTDAQRSQGTSSSQHPQRVVSRCARAGTSARGRARRRCIRRFGVPLREWGGERGVSGHGHRDRPGRWCSPPSVGISTTEDEIRHAAQALVRAWQQISNPGGT